MRRKGLGSILFIVVLAAGLLGATLAQGWAPFLGLDLQGGVSVVLQPDGEATDEQLEDAVSIIRSRVDAIGVAEPEITRQGQTIVVEIPGVEDPEAAVDLVGRTGELRFRPVLANLGPQIDPSTFDLDQLEELGIDPEEFEESISDTEDGDGADGDPADGVDADGATTDEGDDPDAAEGEDEQSLRMPLGSAGEAALGAQGIEAPVESELDDPEVGTDTDAEAPTIIDDPDDIDLDMFDPETRAQIEALQAGGVGGSTDITPPEEDLLDAEVVLPSYAIIDGQRIEVDRLRLGPARLTGAGLEDARASLGGVTGSAWVVNLVFRPGVEGIDTWNQLAAECFNRQPTCPTGQVGIAIDGEVESAPVIQVPSFTRDQVQISGSDAAPFTEQEARDLATVLRYGALPVELEIESQQQVSSSLGQDALQAGLIAGAIGLALVALYMVAFYRMLGLTALGMLVIEGALLWGIISWLGSTQGLALTLAGITGIIVSIGVSLDSNIVFYETIKSDIHGGRSARSAADKSFVGAWRTIVKADVATLIAAVLLYALAVGPVRGFAFYLGLATILDLVATWFFLRPTVAMALRSKLCGRRPGLFGLPTTVGVAGGPPTTGKETDDAVDVAPGAANTGVV